MNRKNSRRMIVILGAAACLLLALAGTTGISTAAGSVIYVDTSAIGDNNGNSWIDAFTDLQDAFSEAEWGMEIWVAEGIYKPTTGTDRTATFQLKSGVELYGGFAGNESSREERDWSIHTTILSGDTQSDGQLNNSYHVVTGSGTDATAIFDGFTITGGNANGSDPHHAGGGMYNDSGSPTLSNITFSLNEAYSYGGGMYNDSGSPTLTNVTFSLNEAYSYGGGMYNVNGDPMLTKVTFSRNSAGHDCRYRPHDWGGGGMYNKDGNPSLTYVTFTFNSAVCYGGGMYNRNGDPMMTKVTFSGNWAGKGGGMYYNGNSTLTNVKFIGNSASQGGGIYYNGNSTLTNVKFIGNSAEYGGGMYNDEGSDSMLTNVTFSGNSAYVGGGMYSGPSHTMLSNVKFIGNSAIVKGGGMRSSTNNTLVNVTFSGNSAGEGGGMYNIGNTILTNLTFSGNSATKGGGMYNYYSDSMLTNVTFSGNSAEYGGGMYNELNSDPTLTNSILWGNTATSSGDQIHNEVSTSTTISYGLIQGGCLDEATNCDDNTIDEDPQFVDADGPDDTLGTPDDNLRLQLISPAIDTGDNYALPAGVTTDLDGNPRIINSIVDLGAYEAQFPVLTLTKTVLNDDGGSATATDFQAYIDENPVPWDIPQRLFSGTHTVSESLSIAGYYAPTSWGGDCNEDGTITLTVGQSAACTITNDDIPPPILYVKQGANGDCTSWTNACKLQTALGNAWEGAGDEIWVAEGTYKPTIGTDRTATFQLKSGVALYGGFAGNESNRDERNWDTNITVLSGDLQGNDNGNVSIHEPARADNSFNVVTGSGTEGTAILDCFTITGGNANGSYPYHRGGGMYNYYSDSMLTNVTFSGNSAGEGGGMYNWNSSPALTKVSFSDNSAQYGGGMYNWDSNPTLDDVTFSGNWARYTGGGMGNISSSPTLTIVTFSDNSTDGQGGGMYNSASSPELVNVAFSGNSAYVGGGMGNTSSSNPALTNVTFSGNSASDRGGGMRNNTSSPELVNVAFSGNSAYVGGGMGNTSSSPTLVNVTFSGNSAYVGGGMGNRNSSSAALTNCILWGNSATSSGDQIHNEVSTSTITYSLVQGGCPYGATCDEHTIYEDPQFVDAANGDLHLRLTSPAIDTGDNGALPAGVTNDLDGNPRIVNDKVDMGAYEDQQENIGDTPEGSDVTVVATDPVTGARAPVTMTFSDVTVGGDTTADTYDEGSDVPDEFRLGNPPTFFDLVTTATISGEITVCIDYSGITFDRDESELSLMHETDAGWEDITDQIDTVNKIICGEVEELSVFTVVQPNSPPEAADDAYLTDEDVTLNVSAPGVLDNDSDVDDDSLTAAVVSDVSNGTLTLDPNGAFMYTPGENFNGDDYFTYQACDPSGLCDEATVNITVNPLNDQPTAFSQQVTTDEDTPVGITLAGSDVETAAEDLTFTVVSGLSHGTLSGTGSNLTYTADENYNGADSFTFEVSDSGDPPGCTTEPCSAALDSDEATVTTVTITVNAVNDAPEVTVDLAEQTVQYSDETIPVTISASDIDSSELSISLSGAPDWLMLTEEECLPDSDGLSCTWILEGRALDAAATFDITITVSDRELDGQAFTTVLVEPEDAMVTFHAGNPVALKVSEAGGDSGFFELEVRVRETYPDNVPEGSTPYPGDISLGQVSMKLVPVGPGGEVDGECTVLGVFDEGYDAFQRVVCSFDAVPVNTYLATVTVEGAYYAGYGEDVLVVYDPSRGYATGGSWFYWPDTKERTSFGFTMEYNKSGSNVKGSFGLIRHLADGSIYQVKSNALYGLSLGVEVVDNEGTFGWASFSGKATYLEPGWPEAIGNHEFLVYVEDRNEPGNGVDHFWIEVYDKDDNLIEMMSMARPATENAQPLEEGNIFVPHYPD